MKRLRLAFAGILLLTGCAATPPSWNGPSELPEAGPVAIGVVKGAATGALVCALPMAAGAYFGPVGFLAGAYITIYCLPFGILAGGVVGAIGAASDR